MEDAEDDAVGSGAGNCGSIGTSQGETCTVEP